MEGSIAFAVLLASSFVCICLMFSSQAQSKSTVVNICREGFNNRNGKGT